MKMIELLAKYEETAAQLHAERNPQASQYDDLVENTKRIISEFEHAAKLYGMAYGDKNEQDIQSVNLA